VAEENTPIEDFYFLHIPKTGGSHFKSRVLNEVYEQFKLNNFPFIRQKTGHDAWSQNISKNTYVTTILRDPAKRTVSHFCHLAAVFPINPKKNIPTIEELKYEFKNWLDLNSESSTNFQAKNIMFEEVLKATGEFAENLEEPDNWWNSKLFKNFEVDEKKLKDRIGRINLLIDNETLKDKLNNKIISEKIYTDTGIKQQEVNRKYILMGSMINNLSKELFSTLSKKEIEDLYLINKIDSEIYFSDYFTDLG